VSLVATTNSNPDWLLFLAKAGDGEALGRLIERHRNYLLLLARMQVGRRLQGKFDCEDLIQEASLAAHRGIGRFRGGTEAEFRAWLRQILAGILANQIRRYRGTLRRDARLERALAEGLDRSSRAVDRGLIAAHSSPSHQAVRREQAVLLADALGKLPDDYREVIVLRQLEELSFADVAHRMARTENSVKNLWVRALTRMRRAMEEDP
jgi:RNA polymerase sigma-70 factor (ECF subfamily)